MDWAMREMGTVELGEQRLNHRVIALLDRLGANAQASIPVACGSWAETKAAYRLFDLVNKIHSMGAWLAGGFNSVAITCTSLD
ncbi:MAG: transposase [Candidatus Symbiodolus clandestinus]